MQVQQIMSQPVVSCRSNESLHRAASLMWDHDIGALPVVNDEGTLVGMITDRDICMAAYTQARPIQDIPVIQSMARGVVACAPDDRIKDAEKKMRANQIRRLPVVGPDGRLVGMLSLNDIALEANRQSDHRSPEIKADEVARTLAAICAPREPHELVSAA